MADMPAELNDTGPHQQLNLETGRLGWPERQRHFARGGVITLSGDMDLVEVASRFVQDDRTRVKPWVTRGNIRHAPMLMRGTGAGHSRGSGQSGWPPGCWCRKPRSSRTAVTEHQEVIPR